MSKLFGATATLQHFYAATSYAYLPLILTALGPVPCLGPLAILVALIWSLFVYVHAVQHVTHLDTGRAILSVVLPVAFMMLVGILLVGAVAISMAAAGDVELARRFYSTKCTSRSIVRARPPAPDKSTPQ